MYIITTDGLLQDNLYKRKEKENCLCGFTNSHICSKNKNFYNKYGILKQYFKKKNASNIYNYY